jgi:hypothetical protein
MAACIDSVITILAIVAIAGGSLRDERRARFFEHELLIDSESRRRANVAWWRTSSVYIVAGPFNAEIRVHCPRRVPVVDSTRMIAYARFRPISSFPYQRSLPVKELVRRRALQVVPPAMMPNRPSFHTFVIHTSSGFAMAMRKVLVPTCTLEISLYFCESVTLDCLNPLCRFVTQLSRLRGSTDGSEKTSGSFAEKARRFVVQILVLDSRSREGRTPMWRTQDVGGVHVHCL